MTAANFIFAIEFLATFGAVIGICLWQLHSLNKLDREEAKQKAMIDEPSDKTSV